MERQFHPVADTFPLMEGDEFKELVEDIRSNGLRQPIVLHTDGRIIDGRNRYRACQEAGLEPSYETWDGKGTEVEFVVSQNLLRRHLSESQRAMIAARLAKMKRGRPISAAATNGCDENRPIGPFSQTSVARSMKVSVRSVRRAARVLKKGVPELSQQVESGQMSVGRAAEIAKLEPGKQRKAMESVRHPAVRKTHYPKTDRIITNICTKLESIIVLIEGDLDVSQLDSAKASEWSGQIDSACKHIKAFSRRLKNASKA